LGEELEDLTVDSRKLSRSTFFIDQLEPSALQVRRTYPCVAPEALNASLLRAPALGEPATLPLKAFEMISR